jgi:hypothetical protein
MIARHMTDNAKRGAVVLLVLGLCAPAALAAKGIRRRS